jgi:tripartite-type tricarboxylate transporter receptor subunit TctC
MMWEMRMRRRALLGLPAALFSVPSPPARGQGASWPAERPIRFIVPVTPGGSQDIVARLLARPLSEALGQSVLVENMPGAGSNIGYEFAARARPDGYTVLAGSDSLSINPGLYPRVGYDPVSDFAPVARAVRVPQILVVRADSGARDLAAFIAAARMQPVSVGTAGNGMLAHLLAEQVQAATGTRWTHVPYRGGAPAMSDLLAGVLQCVAINVTPVTDQVRAGRLRGLFVSTAERLAALPEVPTLVEAGVAGVPPAAGWQGMLAPAGTDRTVVARLNAAVREAVRRPDVAERLAALGVEPLDEPPEAMGTVIRADAERWAEVIRRAGIRPD